MLLPRRRAKLAKGAKDKEHAVSQTPNTAIAAIGIDIGKNSLHVVGHDARGATVLRQNWSRGQVQARLANIPPCLLIQRLLKLLMRRITVMKQTKHSIRSHRCELVRGSHAGLFPNCPTIARKPGFIGCRSL